MPIWGEHFQPESGLTIPRMRPKTVSSAYKRYGMLITVLPYERKQIIRDYLAGKETLTVEGAIALLGVSPATVRRDFAIMAKENLLRQVRGGVAALERSEMEEIPPFALRAVQFRDEKRAVAAAAAGLLQPDQTVFVEGGTTTSLLQDFIRQAPLRIITNSVRLAADIDLRNRQPGVDVYLTGGMLYASTGILLGGTAVSGLRRYHAHWAFLTTGGISEDGLFNTNELVVEIERAMIESAERVAVLADYSKLGHKAMCSVCPLDEIDVVITNPCPDQQHLLEDFRARGIQVIEAASTGALMPALQEK